MRDLNGWVSEIHKNAKQKGWWDENIVRTPLEIHMLIVSEISEATEEVRSQKAPIYFNDDSEKPEGEAVELADAVIRIMDYFGRKNWNLENVIELKHEYNKTRSIRHGGKSK